jgi:hypothetical protein
MAEYVCYSCHVIKVETQYELCKKCKDHDWGEFPRGWWDKQAMSDARLKDNILSEAGKLVDGDRRKYYDHPLENHRRIADLWNVVFEKKLKEPLNPYEVALAMLCVKIARESYRHKRDNLVDLAGYSRVLELILAKAEEEGEEWVSRLLG